jgi:hypothetical protein
MYVAARRTHVAVGRRGGCGREIHRGREARQTVGPATLVLRDRL